MRDFFEALKTGFRVNEDLFQFCPLGQKALTVDSVIWFCAGDPYTAPAATYEGLEESYQIEYLTDVFENLQMQKPDCKVDDYVRAYAFYIENDAFVDV